MESLPKTHYYYSNRYQQLADHLGASLFHTTFAPFSKKLVLLSNPAISEELIRYWIQKKYTSVILGIEFKEITSGLFSLLSQMSSRFDARFPPPLALSFLIEIILGKEIEKENPLYENVSFYLSKGSEERLPSLAKQLTHEFTDYMRYGFFALEEWKKQTGWKQDLWQRVFSHVSPLNEIINASMNFSKCAYEEVFIFGTAHVPDVFKKALEKISEGIPIHYYFQTPTSFFLGDWKTKKEQYHYLKHIQEQTKREEILQHFEDQDVFLSELSPLIRQTQEWLETFTYHHDLFSFDIKEKTDLTLIQHRLAGSEEAFELSGDQSIQIFSCENKTQEVENLYETLCDLLKSLHCKPSDCLVLVSNLNEYLSIIEWVFCAKKAQIPIRIEGKPSIKERGLAHCLMKWLDLVEGRFDLSDVMAFLKIPFVRNHWGFSQEELKTIESLLKKVGIRFGLNRKQRLLLDPFQEEISFDSTWEDGLKRLAYGCVYPKGELNQSEKPFWSPVELSTQEIQLIEPLYNFIQRLQKDWFYLQKQERSPLEWKEWIEEVVYGYFPLCSETQELIGAIHSMVEFPFNDAGVSYASFIHKLKEVIEKSRQSWGIERNAVRFAPYQVGISYQAKVIAMLGMDETNIPRKETQKLSRDLQLSKIPSSADEDRQTFLEALLNAESALIMSYAGQSEKETQKVEKSRLVQLMMTCYQLQEINLSEKQETIVYHPHRHIEEQQEESFTAVSSPPLSDSIVLSTSLLKQLLISPLRFFFQFHHRLYPTQEDESEPYADIYPSPLTRHQLRVMSFMHSKTQMQEAARKQGMAPEGVFEHLTWRELEYETKNAKEFVSAHIDLSEPFEVFLHRESQGKASEEKSQKTLPAIQMQIGQKKLLIEGKIGPLYKEGTLSFSKDNLQSRLKLYPDLVLMHHLQLAQPQVVFLREKTLWSPAVISLETLLKFALSALEHPMPFFPEHIELLFKGNLKKIETTRDPFFALSHALIHKAPLEELLKVHQAKLESVYSPFFEKKKKRAKN